MLELETFFLKKFQGLQQLQIAAVAYSTTVSTSGRVPAGTVVVPHPVAATKQRTNGTLHGMGRGGAGAR